MTYRRLLATCALSALLLSVPFLRAQDAAPAAAAPGTSPAANEPLPTAQSVIDKYVEATGGKEAYASLKSRHMEADFVMADLGIKGKLLLDVRADGNARTSTEIPNVDTFIAGVTDGVVWRMDQTGGPRVLTGPLADAMRESLKLSPEISLDSYKSAEVTAVEDINDVPTYKMVLTHKTFDTTETRFYDVNSGLLLRSDSVIPTEQGNISVTTRYTDYEDAGPIRVAMKTRQSMAGLSPEQVITKIEHNVELPDDHFALPPEVQELLKQQPATQPAN